MHCKDLEHQIEQVDELNDSTFRRVQCAIVAHYRRNESDQESIAIALTNKSIRATDGRTRQRLHETLAMLDHVHDPFITSH